jgi:hypothetical protein
MLALFGDCCLLLNLFVNKIYFVSSRGFEQIGIG